MCMMHLRTLIHPLNPPVYYFRCSATFVHTVCYWLQLVQALFVASKCFYGTNLDNWTSHSFWYTVNFNYAAAIKVEFIVIPTPLLYDYRLTNIHSAFTWFKLFLFDWYKTVSINNVDMTGALLLMKAMKKKCIQETEFHKHYCKILFWKYPIIYHRLFSSNVTFCS